MFWVNYCLSFDLSFTKSLYFLYRSSSYVLKPLIFYSVSATSIFNASICVSLVLLVVITDFYMCKFSSGVVGESRFCTEAERPSAPFLSDKDLISLFLLTMLSFAVSYFYSNSWTRFLLRVSVLKWLSICSLNFVKVGSGPLITGGGFWMGARIL